MSYTKYKTTGLVLGGYNLGEASRSYSIFTEKFGLIHVRAQGIRELKSKLKYSLQNFSLSEIHLVRGKGGWRVTEAYEESNLPTLLNEGFKLRSSVRVLALLRRMLPQDENNEELFDIIVTGLNFLVEKDLEKEEIKNLEILIVLRLMESLGYLGEHKRFENFLRKNLYSREILSEINSIRPLVIGEINRSIKASDL